MTLPTGAYVNEFLYRGQPAGSAAAPSYHVIIGIPGTDAFGNPTLSLSPAMTPDQAAAQGLDVATLVAGFNTALTGQITTLQGQVATLTTQNVTLKDLVAAQGAAGAMPASSVPTALLWQLEAVSNDPPTTLGFTPPTWTQVQAAVATKNNAALTAFFAQGSNPIPANSTTLLALAAALPTPLTAAQVTTLVQAASQVAIP